MGFESLHSQRFTALKMIPSRQLRVPALSLTKRCSQHIGRQILAPSRHYSDSSSKPSNTASGETEKSDKRPTEEAKPKKKTQAELDQEVMAKLQGMDSEGGAAGVEYEDGKPASMKRSVRNNMFRYI